MIVEKAFRAFPGMLTGSRYHHDALPRRGVGGKKMESTS